jgi:hypothetical protein
MPAAGKVGVGLLVSFGVIVASGGAYVLVTYWPTLQPGSTTSLGNLGMNGVSYTAWLATVQTPPSGGYSPKIVAHAGDVDFALWVVDTAPSFFFLEGTVSDTFGMPIGFVVASPSGVNQSVWISPDKNFGVVWVSSNSVTVRVVLLVSTPLIRYASETVVVPGPNFTAPAFGTFDFSGVTFNLALEAWDSPGGGGIAGQGTETNGTTYSLSVGGPPMIACSQLGSNAPNYWGNAACDMSAAPDRVFGIVWGGYENVTLIVEQG